MYFSNTLYQIRNIALIRKSLPKKLSIIVDLHGDLAGILKISTRGKYNASEQKMLYNQITELAKNIEEDKNPDMQGKMVMGGGTNLSGDLLKELVAGVRNCFILLFNHIDAPTRRKLPFRAVHNKQNLLSSSMPNKLQKSAQ